MIGGGFLGGGISIAPAGKALIYASMTTEDGANIPNAVFKATRTGSTVTVNGSIDGRAELLVDAGHTYTVTVTPAGGSYLNKSQTVVTASAKSYAVKFYLYPAKADEASTTASLNVLNTSISTHTGRTDNPHGVTKAQVGLGAYPTLPADIGISTATQNALNGKADKTYVDDELALKADITYVDTEISNIPEVDISGKADKTYVDDELALKADKTYVNDGLALKANKTEVSDGLALKADKTEVAAHTGRTDNPHGVTKAQVGLSNVDNTSDANKPISTAVQAALDTLGDIGAKEVATTEEAIAGVDDSKMMTPLKVQQAVQPLIAPLLPPVDCSELLTMYKGKTTLIETPLINAENCTSLKEVFKGCSNLTTVGYIHCPNVTNTRGMFNACSSLTTIPSLNISSVTDIYGMFDGCSSLTTTTLLNISSVTNMGSMFWGCTALTSVTFQCTNVRSYGTSMFSLTPIESGNGYIFVPDNLVQAYRTATGWKNHASVIFGHSDKENMTS